MCIFFILVNSLSIKYKMDLTKYRKVAEVEQEKLKQLQREKQLEENRIKAEKLMKENDEIKKRALEIFNSIPLLCEEAANKVAFKARVYCISINDYNYKTSWNSKVLNELLLLMDADNIEYVQEYEYVKDRGYGDCYIPKDEKFYNYYVCF